MRMSFFISGISIAFAAWCGLHSEWTYAATGAVCAFLCVCDGLLNGGRE